MAFDAFLIGNEPAIRLGVFVSSFVLIALWELFTPRRVLETPRRVRWANNLALAVVNIFFVRVQIALSIPIKFAVIFVLGPPVLAVLVFEVVFNAVLVFSHANIRIPAAVDRVLRWFMVTPDMHRLHHSVDATETNSNFGFALTWWDRLFGTYRAEPAAGHERMIIGVDQFRARREVWLDRLLLQPFHDDTGPYAINRRWKSELTPATTRRHHA